MGLCGYHIYLGCTNQTTYEMIKPQIVESYIKDEMKRKRRYHRKKEKQKMKELKRKKKQELQREKELKRQQMELQNKIRGLEKYPSIVDENEEIDDEKYQNRDKEEEDDDEDEDEDSDESGSTSSSDDMSILSEKVLLFEQKQRKHPKFKRAGTPTPKAMKNRIKGRNKKRNKDLTNYTNEYRNYFDEGFIGNMYIFLTGKIHSEWKTPLPCTVITKPSSSDDQR